MKVKELIKELQKLDGEAKIGYLDNTDAETILDIATITKFTDKFFEDDVFDYYIW